MSLKPNTSITVCRICLATDVRAITLSGTPLQAVFEKITNTLLHTPDKRPTFACYLCYQHLRKGYKLMLVSAKAENMLTEVYKRCSKITKQSLTLIDRNVNGLCHSLHVTPIEIYDNAIPPKVDKVIKVEVKIEDEVAKTKDTELFEMQSTIKLEEVDISDFEDNRHDVDSEEDIPLGNLSVVKEEDHKVGSSAQEAKTAIKKVKSQKQVNSQKPRNYKCDVCEQRFLSHGHLARHILIHTGVKPFGCNYCTSRFQTRSHLNRHLMCIHKKAKKPNTYQCNLCGSKFDDKKTYSIHIKTHTFECDVCKRGFVTKSGLEYHVKTIHVGEKNIECEFCHIKLRQSELVLHMRLHKKKHQCNVCKKEFKKKLQLVEHFRTHTGEKPFECDFCQRRFSTKPTLIRHLFTHGGDTPYQRFQCKVCTKDFATSSKLKEHLRVHTGEKPYECHVCYRRFRYKHILNNHVKIHTGERPFECTECNQRFIDTSTLTKHVQRNHTLIDS